jgi:hypothetical protein
MNAACSLITTLVLFFAGVPAFDGFSDMSGLRNQKTNDLLRTLLVRKPLP